MARKTQMKTVEDMVVAEGVEAEAHLEVEGHFSKTPIGLSVNYAISLVILCGNVITGLMKPFQTQITTHLRGHPHLTIISQSFCSPMGFPCYTPTLVDSHWYPNTDASHHLTYEQDNLLKCSEYEGLE